MFTFEDLSGWIHQPAKFCGKLICATSRYLSRPPAKNSDEFCFLISKRAAGDRQRGNQLHGPLKLREIEGAQLKIIEVVRRLESGRRIELTPQGDFTL